MGHLIEGILTLPEWVALLVVFALPALEASLFLGFVFPGEIAVILGGVLASQSDVSFVAVVIAAVAGAVIGDAIGYFIGRRWGRRILHGTIGRIKFVRRHLDRHLDSAEAFLKRRGASAVFFGRWTAALRVLVPGLAGMARVPYRTFAIYNFLGGLVWATGFVLVGYLAGRSWRQVEGVLSKASLLLLGLVVLILIVVLVARWIARHPDAMRRFRERLLELPGISWLRSGERRGVALLVNRFRPNAALGLWLTLGLVLVGLMGWAFGAVLHLVVRPETLGVDLRVEHFFLTHRQHGVTSVVRVVTYLGSVAVLIPLAVACALVLTYRRRGALPLFTIAAALGGASALQIVVKKLVHEPRPPERFMVGSYHGYGFPSGHVTQAVALYGAVAALYAVKARWPRRVAAWTGWVIVSVVVGFTRIYLGAHWLSDVLGGAALGSLWLFGVLTAAGAVRRATTHRSDRSPDGPAPPVPAPDVTEPRARSIAPRE